MKFGDAQKICTNLCIFCKGSAMACVSAATLCVLIDKDAVEYDLEQDGVHVCNYGVASD